MSETLADYADLPSQDTWVEHLRTRLPYSFRKIRKAPSNKRQYILSEPIPPTRSLAEYHNFWRRGYVYYAVGRLIDIHALPLYWQEYRISHTDEIRNEHSGAVDHLSKWPRNVFNALQLEKLWAVVADDHLDRERAVMTNVTQAIEFCLKAIKTHAAYRETRVFAFTEGHDLEEIYQSLPEELQLEMRTESAVFAEKYAAFRQTIADRVSQLEKRRFAPPDFDARPDVGTWKNIADEVDRTTYTAFVGANDPASAGTVGCKPEEWFDHAIRDIGKITYHRYSPFQGRDAYPVNPIHLGLMLGRFMYEHLFPITAVVKKESEP